MIGLISFVWIKVNKYAQRDFLSPFNLLLPFWIFPVLLCLLHLSELEPVWQTRTVLMVGYYTVVLTFVSLIIPSLLLREKRKGKATPERLFLEIVGVMRNRVFTSYLLLIFLAGAAAALYNEIISNPGGAALLAFTANPEMSRDVIWQTKGEGFLRYLSIPVTALGPLIYLRALIEPRKFKKLCFLAIASVYPVIALLKLSRSDLFNYCFGCVLIHCWWRTYVHRVTRIANKKKELSFVQRSTIVLVILSGTFASSTVFQHIRSNTVGNSGVTQFAEKTGIHLELPQPLNAVVSEIYMYFALPFNNFAYFVNEYRGGSNLGTGLLRPIYSVMLQGKKTQEILDGLNFEADVNLHMLANTFPIMQWNYVEFGVPEVLIAPWIYGLMMSLIYSLLRRSPHIINLSLFCVMCSYQWIWMFCNCAFASIQFYLYGLFVIPFWYGYKLCIAIVKE